MNNYIKVETKGKFSLYINQPVWCTKYCDKGHFINKNTGEDIGKYKELYIHYYDDKFNWRKTHKYSNTCRIHV